MGGYRVPLRVLWGSIGLRVLGLVINGVVSRVTILLSLIRGPLTPLITTREPPSALQLRGHDLQFLVAVRDTGSAFDLSFFTGLLLL